MDALPSIVSVPQHQRRTSHLLVLLLAITLALPTGFVAGRISAPTLGRTLQHPGRTPVSFAQSWSVPRITGTGPDLVEMAARSDAVRSAPVSGTGPGLIQVAAFGQDRSR